MATGGSIAEATIDGRIFAATADADCEYNLGGYSNEVEANGNGTARKIMMREPWNISGLKVQNDTSRGDLEFLQAVANKKTFVTVAIKLVDGSVYSGSGTVLESPKGSTKSATVELSLGGEGELSKQS